jgi:hypothetical protein
VTGCADRERGSALGLTCRNGAGTPYNLIVNSSNGNRIPPKQKDEAAPEPGTSDSERRRIGRIVHDERGSASVEWWNAPDDYERPVLSVEGDLTLSIKNDDTFNPYDRKPDSTVPNSRTGKRDLKKLSAWLKMMRELEERKKKDED